MGELTALPKTSIRPRPSAAAVLDALAQAVFVVDRQDAITFVNPAGEQFLQASAAHLVGRRLGAVFAADSPLFAAVAKARRDGQPVAEFGVGLEGPRLGRRCVDVSVAPLAEAESLAIGLHERSIVDQVDRQLTHRAAARSLSGLAQMLAHEIKNPLSGIRGAAQLIEETAAAPDRTLARLIRDESDRVCALIDRMEAFSDARPLAREAVNVHQVLDRVVALARSGFGRHLRVVEAYDPSLPPAYGHRDQLVQVFLNLVKNAAEAAPRAGGEIVVATAWRHGVHVGRPGGESRLHLPLMASVRDNGSGIPEDIRPHLFDPFVTSKPKGSGLGLALVAKIVAAHGGVVEFDSRAGATTFRVLLPEAPDSLAAS